MVPPADAIAVAETDAGRERLAAKEPLADFGRWFLSLKEVTKPDLVVGIARSAVRLLQLHGMDDLLAGVPFVSQHALPFLKDSELRAKRLLIFDDSVIFGSVLSKVAAYAAGRGSQVCCAAYAIDRQNFLGESRIAGREPQPSPHSHLAVHSNHRLWSNEIRRHHAALVQAVLRAMMDYNLDFPSFRMVLPKFKLGDVPYICQLLGRHPAVRGIYDVSPSCALECGVYRYVGLLRSGVPGVLHADSASARSYSKVRLVLVPRTGEIRVTPLLQLTIPASARYESLAFHDRLAETLWRTLSPPVHDDDIFYSQALLRLATSFGALMLGQELLRTFADALSREYPVETVQFMSEDAAIVLGPTNAHSLELAWNSLCRLKTPPTTDDTLFSGMSHPEEPNAGELRRAIVKSWQAKPELRPRASELLCESVGKVLLTLQGVVDSPDARRRNPDAGRLDVGLNFEAIRCLLEECGIHATADEVSIAVDICVDSGLAVPKVVAEDGRLFRGFYCGENENAQLLQEFKAAFHRGYTDFLASSHGRALSRFDVHKLCVCLKDVMPWLPISTRFHTFGRLATVGRDETEVLDWLSDPDVGPLRPGVQERAGATRRGRNKEKKSLGTRQVLLLNDSFVPSVEITWPVNWARDFYDAFQFTATAFRSLQDRAKLLLSTCRTHRFAYNSAAIEAHSWIGQNDRTFGHLIEVAQLAVTKGEPAHHSMIADAYWCIRYITEAFRKYATFYNDFAELLEELERSFVEQGGPGARWWEFVKGKRLLDPTRDPAVEQRFSQLVPLVRQMSRLTVFLLGFLREMGLFSERALSESFEHHGIPLKSKEFAWFSWSRWLSAARQFNGDIERQAVPGLSILRTRLPVDFVGLRTVDAKEFSHHILKTVAECFRELDRAVREFCPEYKVTEGDCSFLPDGPKRLLLDGSEEVDLAGTYVLTMDIIRSTNNPQTPEFKERIRATFQRFADRSVAFEETRNDAFVAVCDDPLVLWDIARVIALDGQSFQRPATTFRGTRKGLSYGRVTVVKRCNGGFMIGDTQIPNLLPEAFSMLDVIDAEFEIDNRNGMIAVSPTAMSKLRTQLKVNVVKEATGKGKHFNGSCSIASLD